MSDAMTNERAARVLAELQDWDGRSDWEKYDGK